MNRQVSIWLSDKAFEEIEKLRYKWIYGLKRSEFIRGLIEEVLGISEPRVTLLLKDRIKKLCDKIERVSKGETPLHPLGEVS